MGELVLARGERRGGGWYILQDPYSLQLVFIQPLIVLTQLRLEPNTSTRAMAIVKGSRALWGTSSSTPPRQKLVKLSAEIQNRPQCP